jgi:hypothetical protein
MVTLYLPPSLRYFEPMRVLPNAGMEFMSLEYDLVEALRPALVVDVGTGDAQSYFTLCQSARDHDVDSLCYAIDAWEDDEAKAPEDESRYMFINHFAHAELRGMAYLLQMNPADALMHFDSGMIDLLRLDVTRVGGGTGELMDQWLPRVAPGGLALLPGISGPRGGEILEGLECRGGRRWLFRQGAGLALHRRDDANTTGEGLADLLRLAFFGSEEDRESLERWYAHAAAHHRIRKAARASRWGVGVKKNPRKQ